MRRGDLLRPLVPVVAATILAVGAAAGPAVLAGPRDRAPKDEPTTEEAPPVAPAAPAEVTTDQQAPTLDFGSAAAAPPAEAPAGTVEQIEPIIEPPTAEQVEALPEAAAPAVPADQLAEQDSDDDKVPDAFDNCPWTYNIDQTDSDGDGTGDACVAPPADPTPPPQPDTDGDGVPDDRDNCWRLPNPTQKDGDGDGLGNGCDEGSAPFLMPDEDEVVEAQRVVQEPTLDAGQAVLAGDTAAPVAADAAPAQQPDQPADGERERARDRGNDGAPPTADAPPPAPAAETAPDGGGQNRSGDGGDAGRDRERRDPSAGADGNGGRDPNRDRNRNPGDGENASDAGSGRPSPVERGLRPRRNPLLTEESGPVLPPPPARRPYPDVPGFETLVRIDAGSLDDSRSGRAEASRSAAKAEATDGERSPDRKRQRGDRQRNRAGDAAANTADAAGPPAAKERETSDATAPIGTGPVESGEGSASGRRAPVPIEAGVVIEQPVRGDGSTDGGDAGGEARLTGAVGWQLSDEPTSDSPQPNEGDTEPGDGNTRADVSDAEPANDRGGETAAKDASGRADARGRRGEGERNRKGDRDPAWDGDGYYRGGEATARQEAGDVAGTDDDALYLTQRATTDGDDRFIYAIPVPEDGVYRVRLHFAETWYGADGGDRGKRGQRVFNVDAEGEDALVNFDIYDEVGAMTAVVKAFDVEVDDGTLELEFRAVRGQAVVSAIELLRRAEGPGTDSTPSR